MKWIGQHIWSFISRFRSDVYLEDLTESAQDHVVGVDADGKLYKQDVSVGDITGVTAGDALTGGGTSGTVTINHQDTSSQASVDNSGRTYIQDVTLDTYGHVTGLTSATETVTDTNTMGSGFTVSATTDSNATTITQGDDLFFAAGTGITCETTADGTVTITNTVTDTNTQLSTEQVQDIVGGMVTGNTESGITVAYEDSDGTLDFTVGTLNQDTTGQAGTVATIAGLAPNTATTQAAQPNITTMTGFVTGSASELITDDGDGTVTSRSYLTFTQDPSTATLSMKAPQDTADMLRVNVTTAGATTLSTVDSDAGQAASFTVDCDGLIDLDADRTGIIKFSDGGTQYGQLDTSSSLSNFTLYEAAGASLIDYFQIATGAAGATTISTVDAGGKAADLSFTADGDSIFNIGDADPDQLFKINLVGATTHMLEVGGETGNYSSLKMYEEGGESTNDFFAIEVYGSGSTIIKTVDAAAAAANLQITADGTAELAGSTVTLDSAGAITFERGSNSVVVPDAAGTIQLQGENTGQVVHVNIRDNGSYLFYLFNDDNWYSAGSTTLAILGNSTSPGNISSANSEYQSRVACYTAIANCTIKKMVLNFYWTSSTVNSADIDFGFSKFTPITDGTAATITMNAIAATDCNGSYTEVKPYQKTFTFSGANASLSAGDSFAFHMRTTGSTSSSQRVLVYGSAVLSLELD